MSRRAFWPVGADPAAANGADQSPAAPPTVRPSAPVAKLPARSATLAEIDPVVARHAALARLGNLLSEAAGILHELSQVPLDDARDSRDITCVEATSKPARLLTAEDLAARLQVEVRTIRRWRKAGKIPAGIELGDSVLRWPADQIERWLAGGST